MAGHWQCPGCGVAVPDDGESTCLCPPADPAARFAVVDASVRGRMVVILAKALLHTEAAARGQRLDAVQFHRGYRKGMADAIALVMNRSTANRIKADAWDQAREWAAKKEASRKPPPTE